MAAGCASNDSYSDHERQMSQGMSNGRMGGGGGGRGGRQSGPPPQFDSADQQQELPEEAFTACQGKEEGDKIQFLLPDGEMVTASCEVVDDHLVALPENKSDREMRPGK